MADDGKGAANEESVVVSNLSAATQEQLLSLGLDIGESGYVVWRKDNPAHPRNWTGARKAFDIGLIAIFDLVACVIPWSGIE